MDDQQIKHLEFIQNVIERMARNFFTIKSWAITLVSAILVLAVTSNSSCLYLLVALIPTLTFWGLDGYYLKQEILFRKLYDSVRTTQVENESLERFSMSTKQHESDVSSWWKTCWSQTIRWLYGPISLIIIAIIILCELDDIKILFGG